MHLKGDIPWATWVEPTNDNCQFVRAHERFDNLFSAACIFITRPIETSVCEEWTLSIEERGNTVRHCKKLQRRKSVNCKLCPPRKMSGAKIVVATGKKKEKEKHCPSHTMSTSVWMFLERKKKKLPSAPPNNRSAKNRPLLLVRWHRYFRRV